MNCQKYLNYKIEYRNRGLIEVKFNV